MIVREWMVEPFHCVIVEHPRMGHLCGYVGVPPEHPFFGKGHSQCLWDCDGTELKLELARQHGLRYYECVWVRDPEAEDVHPSIEREVSVHGGITYTGTGKSFVAVTGFKHTHWYIGFDCAHLGDMVPGMQALGLSFGLDETYKDEQYVTDQLDKLERQVRSYVLSKPIPSWVRR